MHCKALTLSLLTATALAASAQANTIMATATANVVETLAVTSQTELNFGYITPGTGGSVTVNPMNQRSTTGGVAASQSFDRATFTIAGKPSRSYTIQVPDSVTFSLHGDAVPGKKTDLQVHRFTTYSTGTHVIGNSGKLDVNGRDTIYLGGTLEVPADAAPGIYRGLVSITVSY